MKYTRQQVLSGYIFLDWFAIPQITARAEGVNEENTKSDAALAVQSIPFYVETSNIFLALVPEVKHETGKYCNYTSWLSRGWCRAELWCHLLSNKPFTQECCAKIAMFVASIRNGLSILQHKLSKKWYKNEFCTISLQDVHIFIFPVQVIVVYSTKESQFMYPRDWQELNGSLPYFN